MSVLVSSEESSWITPPEIIEKITYVLDGIDLDAASSVKANEIVKAERIFTVEDDALVQDWECRNCFLNPPYGKVGNKSKAGMFAQKAFQEYHNYNIEHGLIVLLHSRHGYEWFEQLLDNFRASVTLRERLEFINPSTMKKMGKAKTAQTLFFCGDGTYLKRFMDTFSPIGRISTTLDARHGR